MRLLHRYIIQEFLLPFFYCIITFTFLCVMVDLFGHLDEILKLNIPTWKLLAYYCSFVPIIFVQAAPMAVLLSVIYVLGTFQRHREIVAMKASGLSVHNIIMPFLFLGFLVSASAYTVNELFVPKANLVIQDIREQTFDKDKKSKDQFNIIHDLAVLGANQKMYYARTFDTTQKIMEDLIILEHEANLQPKAKIMAKQAQWTGSGWLGKNVVYYKLSPQGTIEGEPEIFDETTLDIPEKPKDFLMRGELRTDFMNYKQLRKYLKELKRASPRAAHRVAVDLYHRLSFPLTNLVIILVGVPFALRSKRAGTFVGFGLAIALALLYYGCNAVFIAMGKGEILQPFLAAWLANIVFILLGIYLTGKLAT
ncbi:MAG: LptF/LptG family permease [Candidatus Omnitrophota bacterium]